jgi:pyruvate/2-oxoglutarate/acetoin dehydrogenase E1 component
VDLVSLSPLDRATLGAELRTTGRLVVAHDSEPELASAVRLVALDEAFLYLESPLAQSPASPAALASAARQAVDY